jgi:tetratricopeptide (TPR) repeat protein
VRGRSFGSEQPNNSRPVNAFSCCLRPVVNLLADVLALKTQYESHWDPAVLDKIIDILRSVRQTLPLASCGDPQNPDFLPSCLAQLAWAYDARYLHTAAPSDLEEQMTCCETILALPCSEGHHERAHLLLGVALRNRFQLTRNVQDAVRATGIHRRLVDQQPTPSPALASQLARTLWARCRNGDLPASYLNEAIVLLEQALADHLTPDTEFARYQEYLANAFLQRYTHVESVDDLKKSMNMFCQSLSIRKPGHRDRHMSLIGLGTCYGTLYQISGSRKDVHKATELFEETLTLLSEHHPQYRSTISHLATVLTMSVDCTGSLTDISRAIELLRKSLDLWPPGHPDRGGTVSSLAAALDERFVLIGDPDDEEQSIELHREELQLRPPGDPYRAHVLQNFAASLNTRYHRTENPEDVDESVRLYEESLELASDPGKQWTFGPALFGLAEVLLARYRFTSSRADLDRAINLHARWFEQDNVGHMHQMSFLLGAAQALVFRFRLTHDKADLSDAIRKLEVTLNLCTDSHSRRHQVLHDFAAALQLRAEVDNCLDDMNTAMDLQQAALVCVSAGHPIRSRIIFGLSRLYSWSDAPYHDLPLALEHAVNALADTSCSVYLRIQDFLVLLPYIETATSASQDYVIRAKVIDLYRQALRLLPQVAYFGLEQRERLRVLKQTGHLALLGADVAMDQGKTEDAVEMLEEGRAVFWSQYLRLRTNFDALPSELSTELASLSRRLEQGTQRFESHGLLDGTELDKPATEAAATTNRKLAMRFDKLVEDARLIPGFERLLLHEPYSFLSRAAQHCPVVIFISGKNSCDAILVRAPDTPAEHIALSDMTVEHLRKLAHSIQCTSSESRNAQDNRAMRQDRPKGHSATRALGILWRHVMEPIIQRMGVVVCTLCSSNLKHTNCQCGAEGRRASPFPYIVVSNRCLQSRTAARCCS